jgi:hypothetical protein
MQPGLKSGTGPSSPSSATVTSVNGLRLTASSNASELAVGQHLNVSLSIVNTLPKINIVKPSNEWLMHGVPVALWPPCYFGLPAEAAVLQGYYSSQAIQSAANVTFNYICMEGVNVDHVIFQPNSDQVNLTGLYDVTGANQSLGPFHMSLSFTTGGYWNLQNLSKELNIPILGEQYPPRPPAFIPFVPGEYTIAVGDEWGQLVTLHFEVQLSSQGSTRQSEANCAEAVPVPQRPVGNLTPVLTMQPGTMGSICVTYKTSWGGDPSVFNSLTSGWESTYLKNGSFPFMLFIGNNTGRGPFEITATPSSVRPTANMTYVTVQYDVTALPNSTGIYDYSAPYGYCGSVPMVVGFSASQLKGSDFPPRPSPHSCIAELFSPVSVGVVGIGVALVNIPPSRGYLVTDTTAGSCWETTPQYTGNVPCMTDNRQDASVFNCLVAAGTPSGCSVNFGSGSSAYTTTVWYPETNQTMPWANCAYSVSNPTGQTPKTFAYCIPLGSDSFIIAGPFDSLT